MAHASRFRMTDLHAADAANARCCSPDQRRGDQYVFIGMAGTQKAIISWGVGKRNTESTMDFLHDLRSRVIGQPEISTDGFHPYRVAIRDAFGDSASHRVIVKTYSVTHLVKEAQGRYSPAAVVATSREIVSGDPEQ
jgi:hypothetical protein